MRNADRYVCPVKSWNPSYRGGGHVPRWFDLDVRRSLRRLGSKRPPWGETAYDRVIRLTKAIDEEYWPRRLWDHVGSFESNGVRHVITQPYATGDDGNDLISLQIAQLVGCDLTVRSPGVWNEGTVAYIFSPEGFRPILWGSR